MLGTEARRYRFYDALPGRVRMIESHSLHSQDQSYSETGDVWSGGSLAFH